MSHESATPDLVELTRRTYEAANRRDWDTVMGFFARNAVWEVPELQAFEGRAAIRRLLEDWVGAYDDAEIEVEHVLDLGVASGSWSLVCRVGSLKAALTCAYATEPSIRGPRT